MAKLNISNLTDITNGLICKGAVSDSQMPLSAVSESINFNFDSIGNAKTRLGTTLLGNQITPSTDITGLYEFRDNDNTYNRIMAVCTTVLYYLDSATWTSKRTGLTSGSKADFTSFLDYVWMVNGTEATAIWDGSSADFLTTGQASDAPKGSYIENFRSRVWILDDNDRLYYSSLPDTNLDITWDTTNDWIDISPQDGNKSSGLVRDKNSLLVFKNNYIYRVYSPQDTEPDPKVHIGTYSNRSIVEGKNGIYFHHPTGIYRYLDGGVEDISRPISDFIDAVPTSQYAEVCGWTDGDHIYHSLGTLTVNGISYTNVVSRYTISSKVWTIYSYPTKFLCSSNYDDGTTLFRLVGDDDGNVSKMNVGNTDNGTPIFFSLISRPYTIDGLFSTRKSISQMGLSHERAQGGVLSYKVDNESDNKFRTLHIIKEDISKPFSCDIRGNKIWFRLQGVSSGEPITWNGIEILESTSEIII